MRIFLIKMTWHVCRCLFSREVFGRIYEWKMLPRNVFMALYCKFSFHAKFVLLHQQLFIVLIARIRLLWILQALIQLSWEYAAIAVVFTRTGYFLALRNLGSKSICTSAIFPRPFSVEIGKWIEAFDDLQRLFCSERENSRSRSRSLRKFDDPMTDGCQGTKDFLAWQNFYNLQS